jgi:hypothetical protein
MQNNPREMMPRRIQAKQLVVERVGDPAQRMPIRLLGRSERPSDRIAAQARAHVRVLSHVTSVIVVDEAMPIQRIVDNKGENQDQQTENEITLFR